MEKRETYRSTPLSADPVFQKLSRQATPQRVLKLEGALFDHLVELFAPLVREDVKRELVKQPGEEISRQLVGAAEALLGRAPASADEQNAADFVRRTFAEELKQGIPAPDDDEIEDHVHQLSQAVLGNWLAILQRANRMRLPTLPFRLNAEALPPTPFAPNLLFEGLELYAVSNEAVNKAFRAFLEKLREPSMVDMGRSLLGLGPKPRMVPVAPDLVLVASGTDAWHLTSTTDEAGLLVGSLAPSNPLRPTLDPSNFDPRWAVAGVAACASPVEQNVWDEDTVLLAIDRVTNRLTKLDLTQTGPLPVIDSAFSNRVSGKLSILMSECVNGALEPTTQSSAEANNKVQGMVFQILEAVEPDMRLHHVSSLGFTQVIVGATCKMLGQSIHAGYQAGYVAVETAPARPVPGTLDTPEGQRVLAMAVKAVRQTMQSQNVRASIDALARP